MTKSASWFDVDREGLRLLMEGRDKAALIAELIQNAWDEDSTQVEVGINKSMTAGHYQLTVTDDNPDGFADLRDAYTLFKSSKKKGDAEKRGRFNSGEKMVLSLCKRAFIRSTTGTVEFTEDGTRVFHDSETSDKGSVFSGVFKMNVSDVSAIKQYLHRLIPPKGITTIIREGDDEVSRIEPQPVFKTLEKVSLPTVIGDGDGVLRRSRRQTNVELYHTQGGKPYLYEMGIPVVELDGGEPYHINVMQKVPLNTDRDNVTPAFLRELRVAVLNASFDDLDENEITEQWVNEASSDPKCSGDAITGVMDKRFGEKRVSYDPTDPEANSRAVAAGHTLIHGRTLSKGQWANVRAARAALPAGKVTPGHKVVAGMFGEDTQVPEDKWTDKHYRLQAYAEVIGWELLGFKPNVELHSGMLGHKATYGGNTLTLNIRQMGSAWSRFPEDTEPLNALLIHEYAHDKVENHLSDAFHEECCRLGAKLALAVAATTFLLDAEREGLG